MPGMMETVLNLGLNDDTLVGLIRESGDERFAYDTYRRFIQMFSSVVLGINKDYFEDLLSHQKKQLGLQDDTQLLAQDLRELVEAFQSLVMDQTGQPFPGDPMTQLQLAFGNRCQHSGHGVWQYGRAFRNRRGVYPKPFHRREGTVRRISGERARRRCGGRDSNA
jgi:pyruvate,orthophosphate dikinase